RIAKLEKDQNAYIYVKKKDVRNEFGTLEDLELKLANNRNIEKAKLQQQLAKIHNSVKRFQRQLKDVKPTPEFVEKLKEIMEEVENAINVFKEEQRQSYEELMKEEKNSSQEIIALEKKFETWASAVSAAPKNCPSLLVKVPLDKTIEDDLPAEVVEYEKFLQETGGRQGGWDDYDHQNFLKVWTKLNGKPGYMKEALLYLPGRTQEDIQLHENWYQEFLFLDESKKEKEEERTMEEKQHLREEAEKRRKAKEEQKRQLEVKLEVETYVRQKKEQEEFLRIEKEMQERAEQDEKRSQAARGITKFQERDLHKLESKLLEKRAKEEEAAEREDRLAKLKEKVEVHISRDPSRLWRPTKGWEEHTKQIGPTGGGPLLHIPQRAVPSWRQGL
ncbi:CC112 protein, partial [Polyodon spathula]|nr:CC112 protein [Polyodon spathula]